LLYPHIHYAVVLERMPQKQSGRYADDFSDTMLPEGVEAVHPRYAISWRNKWILARSDYVVTCITHSWGGAAKFAEMAAHKMKTIVSLV